MPAKSEKQRKFFGAVMGAKKGQKGVKGAAKKTAKEMTKKEIKKFLHKENANSLNENEMIFESYLTHLNESHLAIAAGTEVDDEGGMAKNQIESMKRSLELLQKQITSNDMQLPGWVQSKISLAEDYLLSVANYMAGETEEEGSEEMSPEEMDSEETEM